MMLFFAHSKSERKTLVFNKSERGSYFIFLLMTQQQVHACAKRNKKKGLEYFQLASPPNPHDGDDCVENTTPIELTDTRSTGARKHKNVYNTTKTPHARAIREEKNSHKPTA